MGVTVAFATTLARVNPDQNGMPILLGSSQTQFVTTQDGIASIVPSAGSVGPCDVFITVSAGASIAQFQMESLAAIVPITVPAPPTNSPAPAPTTPRDPRFGTPSPAPQDAPEVLFAVPEAASANDPPGVPAADPPSVDCPKSPVRDVSVDQESAATASAAASENSVSLPCTESKPSEAKAPEKVVPEKVVPVEIEVVPAKAPSPEEAQPNPASSPWLPEDKRSCRVLAGDELLP
jgi:hypothetical protein